MRVSVCRWCDDLFESDGGRACEDCVTAERSDQRRRKFHITQDRSRMIAVAARAEADPTVVCHLCGLREPPAGYDGVWVADHMDAGEAGSELRPAHRGCNSARGNRTVEWFRAHLAKRLGEND